MFNRGMQKIFKPICLIESIRLVLTLFQNFEPYTFNRNYTLGKEDLYSRAARSFKRLEGLLTGLALGLL